MSTIRQYEFVISTRNYTIIVIIIINYVFYIKLINSVIFLGRDNSFSTVYNDDNTEHVTENIEVVVHS